MDLHFRPLCSKHTHTNAQPSLESHFTQWMVTMTQGCQRVTECWGVEQSVTKVNGCRDTERSNHHMGGLIWLAVEGYTQPGCKELCDFTPFIPSTHVHMDETRPLTNAPESMSVPLNLPFFKEWVLHLFFLSFSLFHVFSFDNAERCRCLTRCHLLPGRQGETLKYVRCN